MRTHSGGEEITEAKWHNQFHLFGNGSKFESGWMMSVVTEVDETYQKRPREKMKKKFSSVFKDAILEGQNACLQRRNHSRIIKCMRKKQTRILGSWLEQYLKWGMMEKWEDLRVPRVPLGATLLRDFLWRELQTNQTNEWGWWFLCMPTYKYFILWYSAE